jgi:hypothetical protein
VPESPQSGLYRVLFAMTLGWSALTFTPSGESVRALVDSWGWLLKEPYKPVLFSILGDVFFESVGGEIYWLNAGTAEVTRVAATVDEFRDLLGTARANDWFLPQLVEQLRAAGKVPDEDQCYTYAILPIFKEGKYDVANLKPVAAREHFAFTAHVHRQIAELPDGASVQMNVGP